MDKVASKQQKEVKPVVSISKGEILSRVFKHMDSLNLSERMVNLFIKNGMDRMDLTELRERNNNDYLQWQKWHRRSNRLMAFACGTVLEK